MPDENLPAVPATAVEPLVLDGEVVDEAAATAAGVAAASPGDPGRSRTVSAILRHLGYVAAGAVVLARKWHARRMRHEHVMRALQAQGNHEAMLAHRQQAELERKQRHDRRRAWIAAFVEVLKASPWVIGGGVALMAFAGLLIGLDMRSLYGFAVPWIDVAHAFGTVREVISGAWLAAEISGPPAVVALLWHLGRTGEGFAPRWAVAARPEDADRGLVVTADTIVVALKHVPVTALAKAMKDGWVPVFSLPPVREGRGYEAAFSLPMGVTAEMIADQKPVLARNLHREPNEVWPVAGAPGEVRVTVIDRGALERAAPEYPLLHEGQADVFDGVPGGVTARGDGVLIPVVGNNGVLGGMMGQGKSNGARVLMLGCATDPLCGLDVFTFANNGDFDAYAPRLEVYRKGLDDDVITAAVDRLHELYRQVGEREQMLADLHAKKVTRQLAAKYPELRPHVSLFSECHELFGHPEYGELAGELAVKTAKRARKTAEVLWFDTQSSRKSAIPPALVELVSVNCCFAVKSWRSNDGFLGDGSFAAGIRATELRPGRDRGTSLITGVSDAQWELLRWYFVEVNDDTGYDAAAGVIARAMENLAPGTPAGGTLALPAAEQRDLLADLAEVTRDDSEPVRLADLPARLRDLAPKWGEYRPLTGVELRQRLTDADVRTVKAGNVPLLHPDDLRRALAAREDEG